MQTMLNLILSVHARLDSKSDRGATATEYAILVAVIAMVVIGGATLFGSNLDSWFSGLGGHVTSFAK
jgi:pilus assembly protein Flp/PilA